MLARLATAALIGLTAHPVGVEVDRSKLPPRTVKVGTLRTWHTSM